MSLAAVGLEADSLDRTADPCVDFYQFACGGWLAHNPIPADRAVWNRAAQRSQQLDDKLQDMLEKDAAAPGDATQRQLGTYFSACTHTAAIEAAGFAPLQPMLAVIGKLSTKPKDWTAVIAAFHKQGLPVVWSVTTSPDLRDSARMVTVLDSPSLSLPDRDNYLAADYATQRAAYQDHLQRVFGVVDRFAGTTTDPVAAAHDVLAIETALAKLTKPAAGARDVASSYHPTDAKALQKQTKGVDWTLYWKTLGVTPSKRLVIGTPEYFRGLDAARQQFQPAQWQHYFTYVLLATTHVALPVAIDNEMFTLHSALSGVTEQLPRSQRCTHLVAAELGQLVDQQYLAQQVPAQPRDTAQSVLAAVTAALADALGSEAWMAEPTRTLAKQKLAALVTNLAYPVKWRTYAFAVKPDEVYNNLVRSRAAEVKRVLARAGKPVDRADWDTTNPLAVAADYDPSRNALALPVGLLQPPFFGAQRSVAVNLGGIGAIYGHELTHALDDQGARFDAAGNLKDWWTPADSQQFAAAGTCVAEQYSTFEAAPKRFVSGALTLHEDVADLGGVALAYRALRALRAAAPRPDVAAGFTEDQQFFLGVGQAWCAKVRPELQQQLLSTDPYAPPKLRVYGALRNLKAFAAAFSCAPGTPMNPAHSCTVW